LEALPTGGRRIREAVWDAVVTFGACTLFSWIGYGLLGKLAEWIFGWKIGWSSDYEARVLLAFVVIFAVYASISTWRWTKSWPDHRQPIRDDLASGVVTEQELAIEEAKVLQDPEHGGLIYFLRTEGQKVFVLYDRESVELAMMDEDPFGSSFEPLSQLKIVKAPESDFVISTNFSGESVDVFGPTELTVSPDKWPEDEEFCSIYWSQIERTLCA